ncbi:MULTISPECIES: hypothetical protein [unclassified Microcoleus]|nr:MULTISPECIES: hypothetical protein [unclassified Microcoleus]
MRTSVRSIMRTEVRTTNGFCDRATGHKIAHTFTRTIAIYRHRT